MLCRTRERWTAAELAEQLEVSERTVYRDVAALQAAGVPLWTTTGRHGGIHLLPGWRSDLGALTGDEVGALSLSGAPEALVQLGLASVAASAQAKVAATLPAELRARATLVSERFHLDAPGWFRSPEPTPQLRAVAAAVWDQRRVDVRYRRRDREVRRRLDPLGLVMKAGTWYLVAAHRSSIRSYRVSRIRRCTVREERATRPDDFVLHAWWERSAESFDRSLLRYRCSLRCSPAGLRRLHEAVGTTAATDARAAADGPGPDGWHRVELWGEGCDVLAHQLLALGPDVEVVGPAELRSAVLDRVRATLAHYDAGPPPG
jgi:predicted DNA-binding transcriptional regulator YafY